MANEQETIGEQCAGCEWWYRKILLPTPLIYAMMDMAVLEVKYDRPV